MLGTSAAGPLVSVVVPAYDAERTIGPTLRSALAQTYPGLEILVVDDGSRDRTAAIAEEFAGRDPRLRLLRKPNGGLSSARNHGLAHARGELIALLDADDLWHPSKVAKQVAEIRRGKSEVGLVYCFHRFIDAAGRPCSPDCGWRYEGDVYAALVWRNFVAPGSTALIRRSCLEVVGGFDETLREGCEDLRFCLAMAERYHFAVVPEFLVGYRQMPRTMSRNVRALKTAYDQVMAEARRKHPELPERVFRWSESALCLSLVKRSWRSRQVFPALALLAPAIARDPAALMTLSPGRAVGRKGRELMNALRCRAVANPSVGDQSFCALPPSVREGAQAWSPTALEFDRGEFVRCCRIHR